MLTCLQLGLQFRLFLPGFLSDVFYAFNVSPISDIHSHHLVRPHVEDGGGSTLIWRVAANILNEQSWTQHRWPHSVHPGQSSRRKKCVRPNLVAIFFPVLDQCMKTVNMCTRNSESLISAKDLILYIVLYMEIVAFGKPHVLHIIVMIQSL